MRAEDPDLAAEEQRRKQALTRYERRRVEWLRTLIGRAADQDVPGAREVVAVEAEMAAALTNGGGGASTASSSSSAEAAAAEAAAAADAESEATARGMVTASSATAAASASGEPSARLSAEGSSGGGGGEAVSASLPPDDPADWDDEMTAEGVAKWREELIDLRTKLSRVGAGAGGVIGAGAMGVIVGAGGGVGVAGGGVGGVGGIGLVGGEGGLLGGLSQQRHEHYARLLKLPRLIDETLTTWMDTSTDDLSDKQIFHELLRMMGLPDAIEPRLMRAMIEAVKSHRLRAEREAIERGDGSDAHPEPVGRRPTWRQAHPVAIPKASGLVNVGGDGSDFALFVATVLHSIGAQVRLTIGCSANATLQDGAGGSGSSAEADGGGGGGSAASSHQAQRFGHACQMFAEVRLGRHPAKLTAWVRTYLPGSRWLGKSYKYRLDRDGYVWLGLDWIDGARLQRPGAPIKAFDASMTSYYPQKLEWETEGEEVDSKGTPKPKRAPIESLRMGVR